MIIVFILSPPREKKTNNKLLSLIRLTCLTSGPGFLPPTPRIPQTQTSQVELKIHARSYGCLDFAWLTVQHTEELRASLLHLSILRANSLKDPPYGLVTHHTDVFRGETFNRRVRKLSPDLSGFRLDRSASRRL
jgi:hypothetical protein